ncbi:Ankyrin-1 [Colletotrichum siamense]|uniref:Ankyrin-1 n=1 Tax=Colletotrichum siamense TaxID=690259 RepID=UPI001872F7E2|nr:Ankyrin-1 [Colletotrichum siamense]KAF5506478.1 Ankyrin-1 [Colletotrichum siamense]
MLGRQASRGLPKRTSKQVPAGIEYSKFSDEESSNEETSRNSALTFWLSQAQKLEPRRELFSSVSDSNDYDNYVSELKSAIHKAASDSKVSRFSRKMKPIHQLASSIAPIMSSASQLNPMPASLVLGGITCILSLTTRMDDFQSKLLETLEWMGDEVNLVNQYRKENIFDEDPSVKTCEINLAADILKFCVKVTELFYDDLGARKNSMVLALKGLCKDFDARFGDVKTDFKLHLAALEKRRDLLSAHRMKSMHSEVEDIGQLLRHEHEERDVREKTGIEMEVNLRNEERRRRFLNWLPSLNFGEIQENNFERRVPGSGTWLLDHPEFRAWKKSSQSALLWVHGKAGSGKSHLAARVINELDPSGSTGKDTALAYAYCTTTQTKTRMTLNSLLGTLLSQLYKSLPLSSGIETLLSRADEASKDEPKRSEMKEGIKLVASRLSSAFIIIDGLDECNQFPDRQFEDFCKFLAGLAESEDSRGSIRVLVFSRPDYKEISRSFDTFPKVQVDNGANDDDIKAYISRKVDEINTDPSPEERLGFEDVKSLMFDNAAGLFLWVHFKAKYFKEIGCVEDIKDALQDTTEGLDDLYGEEIKKILNHPSRFVRDRALRALLWVTNSYRPLTKLELLEALSVKPGKSSINRCQRLSKDISISTECADLVNEVNGVYRLRHASLKDFLSSQLPILLSYGDLQQQAHSILAEACLTYINYEDLNAVNILSPDSLTDLKAQYPLLDYAANFWGDHFLDGEGRRKEVLHNLLIGLLDKVAAMRLTIQILEFRAFRDNLWSLGNPTPLHLLAIFNLVEEAKDMPGLKTYLFSQDEFDHTPIEYSVLWRRRQMTRWLLDEHLKKHQNRRPFDSEVFESCKAWLLHSAAEENWADIVEDLVLLGFDPNICDLSGESPVHAAAKAGANQSLGSLLKMGGSPNQTSRELHTPLTLAAFHMNSRGVDILLEAGAEVNQPGKNQENALHHAAQHGLVDMALSLLNHGVDCNVVCSTASYFYGQTPLHYATRANMPSVVRILIQNGANLESRTSYGDTAVLLACYLGHIKVLEILAQNGAKVSARNMKDKSTALHIASRSGNLALMKVVVASTTQESLLDTIDKNGNTPLLAALYEKQEAAGQLLLKYGAQPHVTNTSMSTPLHIAIDNGCIEVARILLKDHKADPQTPGFHGKTSVHYIAEHGITELLSLIPVPNEICVMEDDEGFTPAHYAAALNRYDFINGLIGLWPSTDVRVKSTDGLTPLHVAARNGATETAKMLIELDSLSHKVQDKHSRLPLHLAAIFGHTQCVALLCTPETIDCQDVDGATPLWLASKTGHRSVVEYLIGGGADVNKTSAVGGLPAFAALSNLHIPTANLLLDNGSIVDKGDNLGVTMFHLAVTTGDERLVHRLLGRLKDDARRAWILSVSSEGWDAMSHAAEGGHANMVNLLHNLGISVDGSGLGDFSPLCQAAGKGFTDFVGAALGKGARTRNLDHRWDKRLQRDALIHAIVNRKARTTKLLLDGGSDPTETDCYGLCAIDYAAKHPNLAHILRPWLHRYIPSDPSVKVRKQRKTIVNFAEQVVLQSFEMMI